LEGRLEVVIFVGLPAAGKTTFYRERFSATHAQISKDNFRSARNRDKRQRREILAALSEGKSVVVDNTNPSVKERASIIELAREWNADVTAYTFELTCAESIERNLKRAESDRVPNVGVYATAKRLSWPKLEEGFQAIIRLRGEGGQFVVVDEIMQTVTE
jgi:predicted kinase